jgi:hypothetical protein
MELAMLRDAEQKARRDAIRQAADLCQFWHPVQVEATQEVALVKLEIASAIRALADKPLCQL